MISRVSALVLMATVRSVTAFNPMNNKPSLPTITGDERPLNAATVGNEAETEDIWPSLTQMIHSKIEENGGDSLSEEAIDELIATAVAGSVVGTIVGSPLIVGAALGFAGSQMLQGENGEKARETIGNTSKDVMTQANAAIDFTKKELANEKDLSKVSKKILLAIQDKAGEMQKELQESASPQKIAEQLPGLMVEKLKQNVLNTVNSDEFKSLPQRSMNAFAAFVQSDDVQKMKANAMQAIKEGQMEATKALKDGLESDEMKALQSRATNAVQSGINTASSKITTKS